MVIEMKGHTYNNQCNNCGKYHKHPKGMLNKKHSEQFKLLISKILTGKKHPPRTEHWKQKQRLSKLGKKFSFETKQKMSIKQKNKILTSTHKQRIRMALIGHKLKPETIEKIRFKRLHQVFPIQDTLPEQLFQKELIKNNIPYFTHKIISNICQCDIFIEPNIVIFVDGCYWHGCEQCFNKQKMSNWILIRQTADNLITLKLRKNNFIVLRFWEHEIYNHLNILITKIKNQMQVKEYV